MIKCRRQATDPQKLKRLSAVVFSFFLLVEAEAIGVEAETVDKIAASTSMAATSFSNNLF